jgi:hypothetical protein
VVAPVSGPAPGAGALRLIGLARAAVGAGWLAALARPDRSLLPDGAVLPARALAVRDLAQGALLIAAPRAGSARACSAVDSLHAASMLPVVALAPRYRRVALLSALTAAAWVAVTESAVRS